MDVSSFHPIISARDVLSLHAHQPEYSRDNQVYRHDVV
jgi:hypothetical protein